MRRRRILDAVVLVLVAASHAGCKETRVIESQISAAPALVDASCGTALMNTYVAELFVRDPPPEGGYTYTHLEQLLGIAPGTFDPSSLDECLGCALADPPSCKPVVRNVVCRCGLDPEPSTMRALLGALEGERFLDVTLGAQYCVIVRAFYQPGAEAGACESCPPDLGDDVPSVVSAGRMCTFSTRAGEPTALEIAELQLDRLLCGGDMGFSVCVLNGAAKVDAGL